MSPIASSSAGMEKRLSRRTRRRLGYGLAGLIGLLVVLGIFLLAPNKNAAPRKSSATSPQTRPPTQVKAPISKEARQVAIRFVQTAVARKNLDEAWNARRPEPQGWDDEEGMADGEQSGHPVPASTSWTLRRSRSTSRSSTLRLLEIALIPKKGSTVKPPDLLPRAQQDREGPVGQMGRGQLGSARLGATSSLIFLLVR